MEPFDKEDTEFQLKLRGFTDIPKELEEQDVIIFHCPYDLVYLERLDKPSIMYNHRAARPHTFMFDKILEEGGVNRYRKLILKKDIEWVRQKHIELYKKADVILSNSKFIQQQFKKFFGLNSFVVYPPVDLDKFDSLLNFAKSVVGVVGWNIVKPTRDYFLSVQRVHWQKRIDIQIEAFRDLKEKLIILCGSGNGINYELKRLVEDCPNIEIKERVNDKELIYLYQNAKAVIQTGYYEDFGLVPVEAMACGTPNIVVDEAGFKETVNRSELGIRIKPPYIRNLRKSVINFESWKYNAGNLREEAEKYNMERFKTEMEKYINLAVKKHEKCL